MIPLAMLNQLEAFLTSDHVTVKGNEFMWFAQMLAAVQSEKTLASLQVDQAARVPAAKIPDDGPKPVEQSDTKVVHLPSHAGQ